MFKNIPDYENVAEESLLNLRGHVDKLDIHLSDAQIQRQNYELEIAGYKSRIKALDRLRSQWYRAEGIQWTYGNTVF